MVPPPLPRRSALDRARALLASGQPRAALALCSRTLRTTDSAGLRVARARALLAFGAVRAAERDLVRALKLEVRTAEAYRLLCEVALRRAELATAEVFLRDALRLDAASPRALELARVVRGWREAQAHHAAPRRHAA